METKTYYVGDRPGGAWHFTVLDQNSGTPVNLTAFATARVLMLGSDNETITFSDDNVSISDGVNGVVTFLWPDESVFTKPGRYVMQIELSNVSTTRRTTVQDILVREMGGITR